MKQIFHVNSATRSSTAIRSPSTSPIKRKCSHTKQLGEPTKQLHKRQQFPSHQFTLTQLNAHKIKSRNRQTPIMISKTYALSLFLSIASTNPSSAFVPARSFASTRLGSELGAKKKIFIDGEAGTTGLQVRDRLAGRDDLEIISIADDLRKDAGERKRLINEADCVILCKCTV